MRRSQRAIGQKMSGGLQACIASNGPLRRALAISRAVDMNDHAYSMR
jgi:hypothetical protein